jgi:hypothetical protein
MQEKLPFRRVYFLGAGWSAGLKYPVGSTLLAELIKYVYGYRSSRPWGFRNSVRGKFKSRPPLQVAEFLKAIEILADLYFAATIDRATARSRKIYDIFRNDIDLAEFFTMADTLAHSPELFGTIAMNQDLLPPQTPDDRDQQLGTLYASLAAATRSYFIDLQHALKRPVDIRSVLNNIDPMKDAVVSFNWDEEVDFYFCKPKPNGRGADIAYTLQSWRPGHFVVLKPHGSIGWYDIQQGISNVGLSYVAADDHRIKSYDRRLVFFYNAELPRDIDGAKHGPLACPPVITPPTFYKRFEYKEQQLIWQDVLAVCRQVSELVFLGYSLPSDDFLTRAAVRYALHANTHGEKVKWLVVDRDTTGLRRNYRSVFNVKAILPGSESHFLQ